MKPLSSCLAGKVKKGYSRGKRHKEKRKKRRKEGKEKGLLNPTGRCSSGAN